MIIVNVLTRRRFRSGAFYLPASCFPPGSTRRAGRFCTAAPTRRAAASGARAPAEELAIFLLPPPSHYNPLNLPHGPHALPAADRIVPSRHPVRQLAPDPQQDPDHRTQRAGTGGPQLLRIRTATAAMAGIVS